MKKRKHILLFPLALAAGFILAACGSASPAGSSSVNDTSASMEQTLQTEETLDSVHVESAGESEETETKAAEPETTEAEEAVSETSGNILIVYYSHTGNTEEAAQKIAELTGGDLAEIKRAEEYKDVYEEAEAEILDGVHPEITVSAENIADYDFSGKTIVPFCTSASDDIGNSLHIFSELCPDAEIAEGLTANDPDEIEPWLSGLGLLKE